MGIVTVFGSWSVVETSAPTVSNDQGMSGQATSDVRDVLLTVRSGSFCQAPTSPGYFCVCVCAYTVVPHEVARHISKKKTATTNVRRFAGHDRGHARSWQKIFQLQQKKVVRYNNTAKPNGMSVCPVSHTTINNQNK